MRTLKKTVFLFGSTVEVQKQQSTPLTHTHTHIETETATATETVTETARLRHFDTKCLSVIGKGKLSVSLSDSAIAV